MKTLSSFTRWWCSACNSSALNWPRSLSHFLLRHHQPWKMCLHTDFTNFLSAERTNKNRILKGHPQGWGKQKTSKQARILCTNCELQHRIIVLSHVVYILLPLLLLFDFVFYLQRKKKPENFPDLSQRNIVYFYNGMFIHSLAVLALSVR